MCGLCGALGQAISWEQAGVEQAQARHLRRIEAMATAAELTRLFSRSRLRVSANPDFGFLVFFPTGASLACASLGDIWHQLHLRGIAIPDPLAHE